MFSSGNDGERRGPLTAAGAVLTGYGALTIILVLLKVMQPGMLVGALILASSAVQIFQAVRGQQLWSRIWHGALGAVYLIAAIILFFRPETGRSWLWMELAVFFLVDGGFRLYLGYRRKRPKDVLWLISSGIASIAIALLIYFALPSDSPAWQIGLLVGLSFLAAGAVLIWLARGPLPEEPAASAAPAPAPAPEAPIEDPI
jgi:uncharacterized membrane protein HdeD (DUF308 family)